MFLCETNQGINLIERVTKKLQFKDRWAMKEPRGRKGGMLIAWGQHVDIKQIWMNDFCIELQIAIEGEGEAVWVIFVYASTDAKERQQQWEFLQVRKQRWGLYWVMGGDFNDIKNNEEKRGGIRRTAGSFQDFRNFIAGMDMGDIRYTGDTYTWANNREGEGFIQERLDRFCGSADWMILNDTAVVTHVLRQTSDHSLLILDSKPQRVKTRARFIFDSSWTKEPESDELIQQVWGRNVQGSRMFQVKQKLKWCKESCIRWKKEKKQNARRDIDIILKEMQQMQVQTGTRNWERWKQLKADLDAAYQKEEEFWRKKSRNNWLREGDKNTRFFHAATAERRKRNRID